MNTILTKVRKEKKACGLGTYGRTGESAQGDKSGGGLRTRARTGESAQGDKSDVNHYHIGGVRLDFASFLVEFH